jgi:hypothetical protein
MTPKDQFRYSVLSAIHDEALSISDAIDQAYGEHVAGKDTEIERLRARSAKFEQLLSQALRESQKFVNRVVVHDAIVLYGVGHGKRLRYVRVPLLTFESRRVRTR